MKLSLLVSKVFTRSLTCSEVMAILMDQPTKTGESHAHMHTMEGFKVNPPKGLSSGDFWATMKKTHWQNEESHLYPKNDPRHLGLYVYPSGDKGGVGVFPGVYQDPDRLPSDKTYATRTGLPALPEVVHSTTITYTVWKYPPDRMGAPLPQTLIGVSESDVQNLKPVGRAPDHYVPQKGNSGPIKYRKEVTQNKTPSVLESPAHTMFPDSESMIMHLTAALLSDAGKMVIRHLFMNINAGAQKTVGIFSKTAVRAVKNADSRVAVKLVERTLEVDRSRPRDRSAGFYPTTGKIIKTESDIDHVVVVLGHRGTGDLNVITCFPSKTTTTQSIGTATAPTEDIAELVFGQHTKVTQLNALPTLTW